MVEHPSFKDTLLHGGKAWGLDLPDDRVSLLGRYCGELARWNQAINLVSREKDESDWGERHFLDSLAPLGMGLVGDGEMAVLDLGAGAGFPGLPLKIVRPGLSLFLAEGDGRKCSFLRHIIRTLPLPGAFVLQGSFRDLASAGSALKFPPLAGTDAVGRFDLVVSRAAAPAEAARDLALPFLRTGGRALFWVTDVPRETSGLSRAWPRGRIHPYSLPFSGRKAVIWEIERPR